jgi:hypothetical protein
MLCIEKDIIFYIKFKINLIIFYNKMNINNLINQNDKNMRNMYDMFSFADSLPNNYSPINQYEENLPFLFSSFSSIITSEDSSNCNITSEDRIDYESKLKQLQNIIDTCNNASNKQECLYNNFTNDNVVILINDLTNIIKKVNKECIYKNLTPTQEQNMCTTNVINNYNSSDLNKVNVFFTKYSNIIKNLKGIADNNIFDYLNKCGTDTSKLDSYNRAQNVLANTLFQLSNLTQNFTTVANTNVANVANTNIANTNVDNTSVNTTVVNTCLNNPEISSRMIDLNNQIRTLTTNNAILTDNLDKANDEQTRLEEELNNNCVKIRSSQGTLWIYLLIFLILYIIGSIIFYVIFKRKRKVIEIRQSM